MRDSLWLCLSVNLKKAQAAVCGFEAGAERARLAEKEIEAKHKMMPGRKR